MNKSNFKRIFALICITGCLIVPLHVVDCYAEEAAEGAIVSIVFTEDDLYRMEIEVGEGGMLLRHDGQDLRPGKMIYSLPLSTTMTFEIRPDKGYRMKNIIYSIAELGRITDITKTAINNKISVNSISTDSKVTIGFEKTLRVPVTGDQSEIEKMIFLGAMSLLVFIIIKRSKKRNYKFQYVKSGLKREIF